VFEKAFRKNCRSVIERQPMPYVSNQVDTLEALQVDVDPTRQNPVPGTHV
jgi:hypothetical protein